MYPSATSLERGYSEYVRSGYCAANLNRAFGSSSSGYVGHVSGRDAMMEIDWVVLNVEDVSLCKGNTDLKYCR